MVADRRIRIAKDKASLVDDLTSSSHGEGPFGLKADVLAFAAALGASKGLRVPCEEWTKEPIRQDVFANRGYDTMINLLAVFAEQDPRVLALSAEAEDMRVTIFEEFANGGLQILKKELSGATNHLEAILLLIQSEKKQEDSGEDFDLSQFVG